MVKNLMADRMAQTIVGWMYQGKDGESGDSEGAKVKISAVFWC